MSVFYIAVCFAGPFPVENLRLIPSTHSISVHWKKVQVEFYATHSVIEWVKVKNRKKGSIILSEKMNTFLIKGIDACSEYNVSVRTMNMKGKKSGAVSASTKTETVGKYQKPIFFFCL
jgi:hypothetical protein